MKKTIIAAFAATALMVMPALADPIEGNWRTASGGNTKVSKCGGSFCIKVTSGEHNGKQIGKLAPKGKQYVGTITDPSDDKTYSGSATVAGSTMKLKGCAMKIFCKTQTWKKQ